MPDDVFQITRRGLLQLVTVIATASFASRRPLVTAPVSANEEEEPSRLSVSITPTKLERFLRRHGIKPAHLARTSGYSRQHLLRVRMGLMLPSRRCAIAIAAACTVLIHIRVRPRDLFDA